MLPKNLINNIRENFLLKNYEKVIHNCELLIKDYPDHGILYNFAGVSCQATKKFSKSINFLKKAIEIEPNNISYMNNLANSYASIRNYTNAEKIYKNALLIEKNNRVILENFASFNKRISNYLSAIKLYKKLLNEDNKNPAISHDLAECYQAVGNFEEANKILDENTEKYPNFIKSHYTKSITTNYLENGQHLDKMLEVSKINNIKIEDKILINYAIGKAYEDKKDFKNAFKYLEIANNFQYETSNFSIDRFKKLFIDIKKFFKENKFNNSKEKFDQRKLIFICGLPRSGTTLASQIVTAHSKVNSVGEISYLKNLIEDHFYENDSISFERIQSELKKKTNELNNLFFDVAQTFLQVKETKYIVDKTPSNCIWMGFIKLLFPNSYILYCKRSYRDNFLSLYKNNLLNTQNAGWACSPELLVEYIKMTDDLMLFWKSLDQNLFYEVQYESLIENPNKEIKKILKYCDLEWQDNCLNFHNNKKTSIGTLSVHQARQPIYKSSIQSYEKYSKYLGKYFDKL